MWVFWVKNEGWWVKLGGLGGIGKKKSKKNEEKWGKIAKNREKMRKTGTFLGKNEKKWEKNSV